MCSPGQAVYPIQKGQTILRGLWPTQAVFQAQGVPLSWKLANLLFPSPLLGIYELSLGGPGGLTARAPVGHTVSWDPPSRQLWLVCMKHAGMLGGMSQPLRWPLSLTCLALSTGLCLSPKSLIWPWHISLLPEGDVCVEKSFKRGCYTPELQNSI